MKVRETYSGIIVVLGVVWVLLIMYAISGCTFGVGANVDWTLGQRPAPAPVIIHPANREPVPIPIPTY